MCEQKCGHGLFFLPRGGGDGDGGREAAALCYRVCGGVEA